MKTFSFFALCFGLSFCIAQTNPEDGNEGTQGSKENKDQTEQDYIPAAGNNNDRSDYYESRNEPERVQYYSGGHRGTNIINPDENSYNDLANDNTARDKGFTALVKYYSGGYSGNNIINKDAVDRMQEDYENNDSPGRTYQDSYNSSDLRYYSGGYIGNNVIEK